jgi:hypothetical protein
MEVASSVKTTEARSARATASAKVVSGQATWNWLTWSCVQEEQREERKQAGRWIALSTMVQ